MAYLEKMSEELRRKVVSLPYRTGLWISESDTTGGDDADTAELEALETIITSFGEDFLKSEFVEEVMQETLDNMDLWDAWGEDLDSVLDDSKAVSEYLLSQVPEKELHSYKQNLMDIATSIAIAYRENDSGSGQYLYRIAIYFDFYMKSLWATLTTNQAPNLQHVLNISRDEKKALSLLAKALDIDLKKALREAMS